MALNLGESGGVVTEDARDILPAKTVSVSRPLTGNANDPVRTGIRQNGRRDGWRLSLASNAFVGPFSNPGKKKKKLLRTTNSAELNYIEQIIHHFTRYTQ